MDHFKNTFQTNHQEHNLLHFIQNILFTGNIHNTDVSILHEAFNLSYFNLSTSSSFFSHLSLHLQQKTVTCLPLSRVDAQVSFGHLLIHMFAVAHFKMSWSKAAGLCISSPAPQKMYVFVWQIKIQRLSPRSTDPYPERWNRGFILAPLS